ncbi:hypothetical protein OCD70_23000 [Bacillus tropicus]|uniref:hypothetical protein n=1 Tax=Bacillus tropicus TaxID=2026188 RepID=UPI0021D32181|nr:hypothetical protein [Bacillus tropicus]MCU5002932.1 hypothetical protein [Bacillus tropicus]
MNRKHMSSAIDVLTGLFYVNKDSYLGMITLELYVELGLLQDSSLIAEVIEEKRSFDLIHAIKLLDVTVAEHVESILRGY